MSIADKISQLSETRTDIQAALVEQGVTDAGSHGFVSFADDIASISGGGEHEEIGQAWQAVRENKLRYAFAIGSLAGKQDALYEVLHWNPNATDCSYMCYNDSEGTSSVSTRYSLVIPRETMRNVANISYAFAGSSTTYKGLLNSIIVPTGEWRNVWNMQYAFANNESMTSCSLPSDMCADAPTASFTSANMFNGCKALTAINLPATLGSSSANNFSYTGMFSGCSGLKTLTLPDDFSRNTASTTASTSVFNGCSSLTSLTIPSMHMMSGSSLMSGCSSLGLLVLGPNAVRRGNLGGTSTSTGSMTYNCSSLQYVVCLKMTPPTISTLAGAFHSTTPLYKGTGAVYVPRAVVNLYETATNWSSLESPILPIEDAQDVLGGKSAWLDAYCIERGWWS